MSTNSTITLAINPKHIGKKKKINKKVILSSDEIDLVDVSHAKSVLIEKSYITIYCHWDGYIENNGLRLLEHFNDYNKVLNLILGGYISTLGYEFKGEKKPLYYYISREDYFEDWDMLKPMQFSTIDEMLSEQGQQYNYLYQFGQWYVQSRSEDGCSKFVPLKDFILKEKKFMDIWGIVEKL